MTDLRNVKSPETLKQPNSPSSPGTGGPQIEYKFIQIYRPIDKHEIMQRMPERPDPMARTSDERKHLYNKVLKRADYPGCADHMFCGRMEGVRVRSLEESYPIVAPEFKDMAGSFAANSLPGLEMEPPMQTGGRVEFQNPTIRKPSLLTEFLRKDFPYRNIIQKKEAKREGIQTNFQDDRVEKYKLYDGKRWKPSLDAWVSDSNNFKANLHKETRNANFKSQDNAQSKTKLKLLSMNEGAESTELLIAPKSAKFIENSVSAEQMNEKMDRDQMRYFFERNGLMYRIQHFGEVFSRAEELSEADKFGVRLRDFQSALTEFYEFEYEKQVQQEHERKIWEAQLGPNWKNLPLKRKITKPSKVEDMYPTTYTRPEGMCNGYPTFVGKDSKFKCCDFITHTLQPMRGEKPAPEIVPKQPEQEQAKKSKELARQAQMLIDDTIKASVNTNFGINPMDALECKEKLANEGKINQSMFQQMLMKQARREKERIQTKSSELRQQTDNFMDKLGHRVVFNNTRESFGLDKKPQVSSAESPSKLDSPNGLDMRSDEKKIKDYHTAKLNDRTFYDFITKEAPVVLLEQGQMNKNLPFHRQDQIKPQTGRMKVVQKWNEEKQIMEPVEVPMPRFEDIDQELLEKIDLNNQDRETNVFDKYISDENVLRIGKLKGILDNQQLFAETIMVNAKTGKQERQEYTQIMKQRIKQQQKTTSKSVSIIKKPQRMTQFQQYQNRLFSMTSNDQIKKVLNISRRQKLNQLTEDICIQRYVIRKFQEEAFEGANVKPEVLQKLKDQYYNQVIEEYQRKTGRDINQGIFDDIQTVNQVAQTIYQQLLEKNEGLKVTGGRIKTTYVDEEIPQIVPNMMDNEKLQKNLINARKKDLNEVSVQNLKATPRRDFDESSLKTDNFSSITKSQNLTLTANKREKTAMSTVKAETALNSSKHSASKTAGMHSQIMSRAKQGNQKNVQQVYLESDYWYHKGVVLNSMEKDQHALKCYEQALQLNPSHKASIFNLACAYEKLGQYKAAMERFTQAINVEMSWPDAHYGLALCCLKEKQYPEAVQHILNAEKYNIEHYKDKVQRRQQRQRQKLIDRRDDILQGNGNSADLKQVEQILQGHPRDFEAKCKERGLCPEDDMPEDELYIDDATKRNEGVSTHIMYVKALCYRQVKNNKGALLAYARVMKQELEISDYERNIVQPLNKRNLDHKKVEGPGAPGWKIDLYSHFKRLKLLKENNRLMMVDLNDYYDRRKGQEGWKIDKIDYVVDDLQRIRFFNRFDKATLMQMMKKTDLRVVLKNQLLFLEEEHCAIVINGNLFLFSHKEDVATPICQAIYGPGDIIGNSKIDGGWSRDNHSWIIAYEDCDVLLINREYVDFMWDKMKRTCKDSLGWLVNQMKKKHWFENMTEQSIYTLAFDMVTLKKFKPGSKICEQSVKSVFNIEYRYKSQKNVEDLTKWMQSSDGQQAVKIQQQAYVPQVQVELDDLWETWLKAKDKNNSFDTVKLCVDRTQFKEYFDLISKEINRRETTYGKKQANDQRDGSKKQDEEETARSRVPATQLQLFKGYPGQPKSYEELEKDQRKIDDMYDKEAKKEEQQKLDLLKKATDEEMQRIKKFEPLYKREVERSYNQHSQNSKLLEKVLFKMYHLLETYSKSRREGTETIHKIPKDPDGIYLLIDGNFAVKNEYNWTEGAMNKNPVDLFNQLREEGKISKSNVKGGESVGQKPELMDIVGAEKYLQVQGYTYYGCLYSANIVDQLDAKKKHSQLIKTAPQMARGPGVKQISVTKDNLASTVLSQATSNNQVGDSSEMNPKVMTVGYIDSSLLNLIPFYDLYLLKDELQKRYKDQLTTMKVECKRWFSDINAVIK